MSSIAFQRALNPAVTACGVQNTTSTTIPIAKNSQSLVGGVVELAFIRVPC